MKKIILGSAIFLFTAAAIAKTGCEDLVYRGVFPTSTAKTTILCKNGFVVGYSTQHKTPIWVAERISIHTLSSIINHRAPFHKDEAIPSYAQPSNSDYVGTGYDKGHLVSFEDMSYSAKSAYDSMALTNIVPQNFTNNRGGWKSLENYARKLGRGRAIYVVSGPLFVGRVDYIGNKVPIPTHVFKTIIDPIAKTSKTWILPNKPVTAFEVQQYVATRASVARAGVVTNPNSDLSDSK